MRVRVRISQPGSYAAGRLGGSGPHFPTQFVCRVLPARASSRQAAARRIGKCRRHSLLLILTRIPFLESTLTILAKVWSG